MNKKVVPAILFGLFLVLPAAAFSQTTGDRPKPDSDATKAENQPSPPQLAADLHNAAPFLNSVRDVELGMSVDEVKKQLGKPEVADDTGLYFSLSGGDSVQIGLDANKKVRTVASIYAAGSKSAPSLPDIFGKDVARSEGDVYKIVRYPDAGYWVSYSRTNSKDKPIVVVTMRKIF